MVDPSFHDEVLALGQDGRLVGIVSHPSGDHRGARSTTLSPGTPDPGLILLNAGVLHRVGPHRLHVVLARRLAGAGMTGLRLDLGGIGDSTASPEATSFRDSAVADTQAAMTAMTEMFGVPRFVLFGICAGADNAIATALADDRVTGIILVDPPTHPTRRSRLRYVYSRIARRGRPHDVVRWGLLAAERGLRRAIARRGGSTTGSRGSGKREAPPLPQYRAQLTRIVDRGVRVLAVFSGIHGAGYNHPDQLFEWFPALRGRIDHAYFAHANHTFTELSVQAELVDTVARWLAKNFH
ncbi:MAG TPA: alpha/beta fold hydrolase [Kofleriaceae bacterium]|jgi:hypothetical protein|nr:alpha/beta fold hydrolase [Kofleriaceae bacterium]